MISQINLATSTYTDNSPKTNIFIEGFFISFGFCFMMSNFSYASLYLTRIVAHNLKILKGDIKVLLTPYLLTVFFLGLVVVIACFLVYLFDLDILIFDMFTGLAGVAVIITIMSSAISSLSALLKSQRYNKDTTQNKSLGKSSYDIKSKANKGKKGFFFFKFRYYFQLLFSHLHIYTCIYS